MIWVWPSLNSQKGSMKIIRLFPKPTQSLKLYPNVFQAINFKPVILSVIRVSRKCSRPSSSRHRILKQVWLQVPIKKTMGICLSSPSKNKHKNAGTLFLSEPNKVILFRLFSPFQGEVTCISVYTNNVLTQ